MGGKGGNMFANMFAGKGAGKGGLTGEVRYDFPMCSQMAVQMLNGSMLKGSKISVEIDYNSKDMSKLVVKGIPHGVSWQDLKDHFSCVGQVAFANVKGGGK